MNFPEIHVHLATALPFVEVFFRSRSHDQRRGAPSVQHFRDPRKGRHFVDASERPRWLQRKSSECSSSRVGIGAATRPG